MLLPIYRKVLNSFINYFDFLSSFLYRKFLVSFLIVFSVLSRKHKKLSHFLWNSDISHSIFLNPVETTLQEAKIASRANNSENVCGDYSKLIARFRAMPTRPTLRIPSCDTNRRKTTILAFCIAGPPIHWEEWNHLVLSNLFLQVRKKNYTYSSAFSQLLKILRKSVNLIFAPKFKFASLIDF